MADYRFIMKYYDDLPGATGQIGSYRLVDVQIVPTDGRKGLQQTGKALYTTYNLIRGYSSSLVYWAPVQAFAAEEPFENPYLPPEEQRRLKDIIRTYGLGDDWTLVFADGPMVNVVYVGDDGSKPTFIPITRFIDP